MGGGSRAFMRVVNVCAVVFGIKAAQLAALFASPAIWDTSTEVLFDIVDSRPEQPSCVTARAARKLAQRLLIWDNVYFASLALDGPNFEHEYAFSRAWARAVHWVAQIVASALGSDRANVSLTLYALTAASLSLCAHLAACYAIALLAVRVRSLKLAGNGHRVALIYAIHPAGSFLFSGYAESAFALLSFVGLLFYTSRKYLFAGAAFTLALQLRSNGLLWGILFVVTLLGELLRKRWHFSRIVSIVAGGALVGTGFVVPQLVAYRELCTTKTLAWCSHRIPSVYSYVQSYYWNNGFLNYWTLANLPNFLIALPTLVLLAHSVQFLYKRHLLGLAAVHAVTLVGAVLFWHVQIVVRLSSCLPGPTWYVSSLLSSGDPRDKWRAKLWITYFLLWLGVQAALYGAFLPPA